MNDPFEREVVVFGIARRLPEAERSPYLDEACAGDAALRRRVEELLQSGEQAEGFLQEPAPGALRPEAASAAPTLVPNPAAPGEKAGDRIGRYKLLQQIGEGGCGVVYMAEQEEPVRRRVALKVIKLGMDTKSVIARFEAERQALAMMDHPNIAKVLDAGATGTGRPYFVMELVRGIKITEYCDEHNLSMNERLDLFMQVCHAVQHAHQKGIIHRDLKPSNILVASNDGVPVPKVIDFGIAKATQGRLTDQTLFTAFEQFIGTPAYMSPEQAELTMQDVDTRTDIYSLGVLLYELLTGRTPFEPQELLACGLDAMRRTIREQEPARPSTRLSTMIADELTTTARHRHTEAVKLIHLLRRDLDWIAMKCLEKDRARRYETANGLALDVQRYLDCEPVVARPPSRVYRFQRLVRRNKVIFAAGGAVCIALNLGLALSIWQAIRATRAERTQLGLHKAMQAALDGEAQQRRRAERAEISTRQNLYAANMNLAAQAWDQNNVGRLRELLKATATYPGLGFEWYYWQRQAHLEIRTFRGHTDLIRSGVVSPDGRRIATASTDRTAKLWDAASGQELLVFKPEGAAVWAVAFSPDGGRIATGCADNTAAVWDAASGRPLVTLKGQTNRIGTVAWSSDGGRIVTGSADKTAKVWDAATGKELFTLQAQIGRMGAVSLSPDGRRIVTACGDTTARLWDLANGKELRALVGHHAEVMSVAFSPDGQRIATGSEDHTAKLWDAATGQHLRTLEGHQDAVMRVAFSPDGQLLATASLDGTAKLWDATGGKELRTFKGHSAGVFSASFSPDGKLLLTTSEDQTAKLWDAAGGSRLLALKRAVLLCMAFSPDGQRLATPSGDQTAIVWEPASGKELLRLKGSTGPARTLAFSPDGRLVVSGGGDNSASVWDAINGNRLFTLTGHRGRITSAAYSPDGQTIATGSTDFTARLWKSTTGNLLQTLKGHTDVVRSVAFSPDNQQIATASEDHTAKVWAAASGRERRTLRGHDSWVTSVAFSYDGQKIVTGSADQTAKVWSAINSNQPLTLTGHSAAVNSVAFSPDSQRILTCSKDKTARLWDAATGNQLLTLKGHSDAILLAAFSPLGHAIVTASADQSLEFWDAATPQQVSAWQLDETQAAGRLAASRREALASAEQDRALRAKDPGAIKQWLVLAPIALSGLKGEAALGQEQILRERSLRPRAGQRVKLDQGERVWRTAQLDDFVIDFNEFLGEVTEWSVAYAVCYIRSDAAQTGLLMRVGSDDQALIYLNGNEIYRNAQARLYTRNDDLVRNGVQLKAGINVLVFKVVNETGKWQGSVRFTDPAGQPVQGISVTLDPGGLLPVSD